MTAREIASLYAALDSLLAAGVNAVALERTARRIGLDWSAR